MITVLEVLSLMAIAHCWVQFGTMFCGSCDKPSNLCPVYFQLLLVVSCIQVKLWHWVWFDYALTVNVDLTVLMLSTGLVGWLVGVFCGHRLPKGNRG